MRRSLGSGRRSGERACLAAAAHARTRRPLGNLRGSAPRPRRVANLGGTSASGPRRQVLIQPRVASAAAAQELDGPERAGQALVRHGRLRGLARRRGALRVGLCGRLKGCRRGRPAPHSGAEGWRRRSGVCAHHAPLSGQNASSLCALHSQDAEHACDRLQQRSTSGSTYSRAAHLHSQPHSRGTLAGRSEGIHPTGNWVAGPDLPTSHLGRLERSAGAEVLAGNDGDGSGRGGGNPRRERAGAAGRQRRQRGAASARRAGRGLARRAGRAAAERRGGRA